MYNSKLHFHFTGIGGTGMSGLAEILLRSGFKVSGSDLSRSAVTARLEGCGATIAIGHAAAHVAQDVSLLVFSSAVKSDNPELEEARRRGLPIVRRAEVLAELMRLKYGVAVAGSHGKTTTTSMIAAILEHAGLDPTVVIGGQVRSIGSGGKLGKGDFLVAESDESDRSFLLLKPTVAVVTNIDSEHLNAYESLSDLESSFAQFVSGVPFYGLAVFCVDDPKVRDLAKRYGRRFVTYGLSPDANLRADEISHRGTLSSFDVWQQDKKLARIELPMPGTHIVVNSLAAIAVGLEFGVPIDTIRSALACFGGVGRRLEVVGEVGGVTVINDYGHHPTEVRATLKAVRDGWGAQMRQLHVIFQPHRFSRTKDCFVQFLDAFREADSLTITEIYAAGEAPIEGVSAEKLLEAMSHPSKRLVKSPDDALAPVLDAVRPGDVVVCLGAGSIGALPEKMIEQLRTRAVTRLSAA